MPNGFSLGLLQMQKELTNLATPQYKIEPYGLLASLYLAHTPGAVKVDSFDGHFKTVKVKRKQRFTAASTSTTRSCDTVSTQPYLEQTVSVNNFRQLAFHIQDETIAAFDKYASGEFSLTTATPEVTLMFEFMDTLQTACSALLEAVNSDLCVLAASNVGVNRRTGNNNAAVINIPLNTTNNPLTDSVTQILRDFKLNNMAGKPIVVGAGLFHNWILSQAAKVPDQSGVDSRIQSSWFDFYQDETLPVVLGDANEILVYEKDSIQIVEYLQYQGFKAGPKPGASTFGTLVLPMSTGGQNAQLIPIKFDFQLRYNDCDQEFTVDGSTTTLAKGYNLIVSKTFGLYTIPTDAYRPTDVLYGNRGSLRYKITNT